ncbi:MAG: hypothetical protein R6T83_01635 [Salinibacter sp.]
MELEDEEAEDVTPWWGAVALNEETGGRWDVGPSTLWVYRGRHDWRFVHRPSTGATTDPMAHRSEATVPVSASEMDAVLAAEEEGLQTSRHSVRRTEAMIHLRPALADRPVVSRPEHPLHVPPGESVTLYLSTALWIQVVRADEKTVLQEVPSHRMSDTWFGPSTLSGELCYATRTAGRLRLDHLPLRLHRAVTPLRVQNQSDAGLALERVQLPTPHLTLYQAANDTLWTNAVTMRHVTTGEGASVHVREGAPDVVEAAEKLRPPRTPDRRGLMTSTFGAFEALFGS